LASRTRTPGSGPGSPGGRRGSQGDFLGGESGQRVRHSLIQWQSGNLASGGVATPDRTTTCSSKRDGHTPPPAWQTRSASLANSLLPCLRHATRESPEPGKGSRVGVWLGHAWTQRPCWRYPSSCGVARAGPCCPFRAAAFVAALHFIAFPCIRGIALQGGEGGLQSCNDATKPGPSRPEPGHPGVAGSCWSNRPVCQAPLPAFPPPFLPPVTLSGIRPRSAARGTPPPRRTTA
jgi:hypothetical protein